MHPIEVSDGQRAAAGDAGMLEAPENVHGKQ
jgi:hypothetical protein